MISKEKFEKLKSGFVKPESLIEGLIDCILTGIIKYTISGDELSVSLGKESKSIKLQKTQNEYIENRKEKTKEKSEDRERKVVVKNESIQTNKAEEMEEDWVEDYYFDGFC